MKVDTIFTHRAPRFYSWRYLHSRGLPNRQSAHSRVTGTDRQLCHHHQEHRSVTGALPILPQNDSFNNVQIFHSLVHCYFHV